MKFNLIFLSAFCKVQIKVRSLSILTLIKYTEFALLQYVYYLFDFNKTTSFVVVYTPLFFEVWLVYLGIKDPENM